MSDLGVLEAELEDIRQEIHEVERQLEHLMSVDTTNLYFNVDGMKKLTEVAPNAWSLVAN